MKRRIISLMLLLSLVYIPVRAENAPVFNFYDTFDSCATNDKPSKGTFTAEEYRVIEIDTGNKGLMLKSGGEFGVIDAMYQNIGANGSFVFSTDIYVDGDIPEGDISVTDSAGKTASLFSVSDKGLGIMGGYKIGGISRSGATQLAVAYNASTKLTTVYVNGRVCVENWYLKNEISGVSKVNYHFSVGEKKTSQVTIDNLYVYSSDTIADKSMLPKETFNSEEIDYEPEVQENMVYFYRDFDEKSFNDFDKINDYSGANTAEVQTAADDNRYLFLEKTAAENCVIDIYPNSYTGMDKAALNGRFAIEQCDVSGKAFGSNAQLMVVDGPIGSSTVLVSLSGNKLVSGGQTIATLKKDEWVTVSAAMDFVKSTYSVYVNYKPVITDANLNTSTKYFSRWRIMIPASAANGDVCLDKLCVYNEQTPREINFDEAYKETSYITADTEKCNLLKSFDVVNYKSNAAIIRREKSKIDNLAYTDKKGNVYLNVKAMSELYGKSYAHGSNGHTVNGKIVSGTVENGGIIYAPYSSFLKEIFEKNSLIDDRGIILISSNAIDKNMYGYGTENDLWDIVNLSMYDRPSAEELKDNLNPKHPRIIYSEEEVERVKAEVNTSAAKKKALDRLTATAETYLTTTPVKYDLSSGTILLGARKSLNRVMVLGQAYMLTNKGKYAERVWQEAKAICEYPDFHPDHFLDTGELSATLAIAYDWCYNYYTPEQRKIIEEAILRNSVNTAKMSYYFRAGVNWTHWINHTGFNQNAVNSGGCLMAATAIMDIYPEECGEVASLAIKSLEAYTQSFYPSGAYGESTTYYTYGMSYWARAIGTLHAAFGTDFGLSFAPKMKESTEYSLATTSYVANNNYHDTENTNLLNAVSLFDWFAHEYEDESLHGIKNYVYKYYGNNDIDLFYGSETEATEITSPEDMYLSQLELVSLRSSWAEPNGAFISMHAGDAFPGHGHIDTGTFVIDMMGERFASDLGSEDYNHLTWLAGELNVRDAKPYDWITRPEGHNCLVINPRYECGHNLEAFAPVTAFETGNKNSFAVADLSQTCEEDVTSYQRGYYLGDDRRSVMVRDEVVLRKQSELYWFMHTPANITVDSSGTSAILDVNGKKVKAVLVTNIPDAKFSIMEEKPLETSPQEYKNKFDTYRRLTVHTPQVEGNVYIQVKLIPASDPNADKAVENMPISTWEILDGEREVLPVITGLMSDGVEVKNFNENVYSYVVNIAESQAEPTKITAQSDEGYDVEVIDAASVNDEAKIIVTDTENPELTNTYSISYNKIPKLPDVDGYERLQVYDVYASSTPQSENGASNVNDNNLSTRYAVEGSGEWVELDLGSSVSFDSIALAIYYGDSRKNFYEIEVSDDGENYRNIFKGETSGTTADIEVVDIPDTTARYIRYVTQGSTAGTWNSVTEFGALKKR
ncbi:MAG: discoidin domain-containing protein [Clostridia bacterium]|nr:discoidin domain-containing protein [Clostridia bacterium]